MIQNEDKVHHLHESLCNQEQKRNIPGKQKREENVSYHG